MIKLKNFLFLLLFYSNHLFAWSVKVLSDKDLHDFYIVDSHMSHPGTDAAIRKISDGIHVYILKQIHESSFDEQFLLINDAVASTIAMNADIRVNEVFFIPFTVAGNLKIYPDRAATLHNFIAGQDLESEWPKDLPDTFRLHQRYLNTSVWQEKEPLAEKQQGLHNNIIESMSLHEDLPPLVAFDTFVGNVDRSFPNIFFDAFNNRFYGIDHAAVFGKNMIQLAIVRIKELLDEGYFKRCGPRVIHGLQSYKNTMIRLLRTNTAETTAQNMYALLPHLGADLLNTDVSRMHYHATIIKSTYRSLLELVSLLEQI